MLRYYQVDAVEACYRHLEARDDNPCIVAPTGSGKSHIIAQFCHDAVLAWQSRVIVLAHVKELLVQNRDKIVDADPALFGLAGVYSAGLKARDTEHPIIVAGVQSVYQRAADLGRFDLVIVDEAHLLPPDGEGMYRTLIAGLREINPALRVIGLTATPFRTGSGYICAPDNVLNHICHEIPIKPLIAQGYLCPLRSRPGEQRYDFTGAHIRAGEFVQADQDAIYADDDETANAVGEVIGKMINDQRKAVLIFAASVEHGKKITRMIADAFGAELYGDSPVAEIYGDTPAKDRDAIIARFRKGELRILVNCNVLTTGFDVPHIDLIALMRMTASPGLYAQMVGRALRMSPGKKDALIMDFGGNVARHGPIDAIRPTAQGEGREAPVKECPACGDYIPMGATTCPECGAAMPRKPRTVQIDGHPDNRDIVSEPRWKDVKEMSFRRWVKSGNPETVPTLRVDYQCGLEWFSEWLCFEHEPCSFPQRKARAWWLKMGGQEPEPVTVDEAMMRSSELGTPSRVEVTPDGKYHRVTKHEFGGLVAQSPKARDYGINDEDESPF